MVLPLLAAMAIAMTWMVAIGAAQLRATDAAREVARSAARGDSTATATGLGRRVAGSRARVSVGSDGRRVVAEVTTVVEHPGGLLAFLPAVHVHAQAVAAAEPSSTAGGEGS